MLLREEEAEQQLIADEDKTFPLQWPSLAFVD